MNFADRGYEQAEYRKLQCHTKTPVMDGIQLLLDRWKFGCNISAKQLRLWKLDQTSKDMQATVICTVFCTAWRYREVQADDTQHQWHQHKDQSKRTEAWDSHDL